MKRNGLMRISVAACFAVLPAALGRQVERTDPAPTQAEPSAADLGPNTSVMIVPVVLAGNPWKDVADVVASMLEKGGMPNVWTTEAEFEPDEGADLTQVASAFGEWVPKQGFKTDCVLFAQIVGDRARGVAEVRAVLADAAGRVIWTDRQTPKDRDFRRVKPHNPMTFCVLLNDRLQPQFHLTSATRGRVKDGRMARLGAAKSGSPPKEECAAMERRVELLKKTLGDGKLLVYPVQTGDGANAQHAANLVRKLNKEMDAQAVAADTPLEIEIAPSRNEQKRLWDLARRFREHVRKMKPDTDYALVAEYLIVPHNKQVWTVHFVICDRAGEWVIVDFQNNQHKDFNAIKPKAAEDCADLVVRRVARYLK